PRVYVGLKWGFDPMSLLSRRRFLASSAACGLYGTAAAAVLSRAGMARAASPVSRFAESRIIEIGGKAAKVFGLASDGSKHGLSLRAGTPFHVRLRNMLDEPTLIHW